MIKNNSVGGHHLRVYLEFLTFQINVTVVSSHYPEFVTFCKLFHLNLKSNFSFELTNNFSISLNCYFHGAVDWDGQNLVDDAIVEPHWIFTSGVMKICFCPKKIPILQISETQQTSRKTLVYA